MVSPRMKEGVRPRGDKVEVGATNLGIFDGVWGTLGLDAILLKTSLLHNLSHELYSFRWKYEIRDRAIRKKIEEYILWRK